MTKIEVIEKYPTKSGATDPLGQPTLALKWRIGDSFYGAWVCLTGDDEDDLFRLFAQIYWFNQARRHWYVRVWFLAKKFLFGRGIHDAKHLSEMS